MDNTLKIILVVLVCTAGCVISESKIRCYGKSLDDYTEYDASEIEKMMDAPQYSKSLCTFLFIHGFNATITGPAITTIIPGAINKGGWNVCLWNWIEDSRASDLIGTPGSYGIKVLFVVQGIGHELAYARAEVADKGLNVTCLHIYAHSLGAHIAGYAGDKLKDIDSPSIGWIYGLDPAGPLYDGFFTLGRPLCTGDALYVGCLHTDPGNKGINASNCDMDIWANRYKFLSTYAKERVQPDCPEDYTDPYSDAGFCSHNYSWKLINASFVYDFPISCDDNFWDWARSNGTAEPVTLLGEKVDISLRGDFYFSARGKWTYTLGADGLRPYFY